MIDVISSVREELRQNSEEKTRQSGLRFFKEEVELYGVKSAVADRIGRKYYREIKDLGKRAIFGLCEELWQSGYMEESFIACHWSYYLRDAYQPADIRVFEKWLQYHVSNWASCDTLCNHTVGAFLELYPEHVSRLKKWARSKNRWMRRAAAVSLILPARKGLFWQEIRGIADILLEDRDDLVQKGYGWMLKAASQSRLEEVFAYVLEKKSNMPRTALRYAIEKMPRDMRLRAMEK